MPETDAEYEERCQLVRESLDELLRIMVAPKSEAPRSDLRRSPMFRWLFCPRCLLVRWHWQHMGCQYVEDEEVLRKLRKDLE